MAHINFSDKISVPSRDLYLQTNTQESGKSICALYDGGRILHQEIRTYESDISEYELAEQLKAWHYENLTEIEFLYSINARIKTVRHPVSLIRLGRQFLKWSLLDEAISELELALEYDNKSGDAYAALGRAFLKRGSSREAIDVLQNGCDALPQYADLWQLLGTAFFREGRLKESIGSHQRALKINRSYDEAHISLAMCYLKILVDDIDEKGFPDKALCTSRVKDHLNRATAISVRFQTQDFEEAMRTFHAGDAGASISILKNVIQDMPVLINLDFLDLFYLNYMYGEKGKQAKEIAAYIEEMEFLTRRFPKYADLHNHLGTGYLLQCRVLFNRALNHFRAAVNINPRFDRAKRNLKLAENDGKGLLILLRALLK